MDQIQTAASAWLVSLANSTPTGIEGSRNAAIAVVFAILDSALDDTTKRAAAFEFYALAKVPWAGKPVPI